MEARTALGVRIMIRIRFVSVNGIRLFTIRWRTHEIFQAQIVSVPKKQGRFLGINFNVLNRRYLYIDFVPRLRVQAHEWNYPRNE